VTEYERVAEMSEQLIRNALQLLRAAFTAEQERTKLLAEIGQIVVSDADDPLRYDRVRTYKDRYGKV
jgi:uracil phosphoribosyltransferase